MKVANEITETSVNFQPFEHPVSVFEEQANHRVKSVSLNTESTFNAESALLNPQSLQQQKENLFKVINVLSDKLANVYQPFTGIQPSALSALIQAIDIETPLPSLDSALDELQRIYLKDAVYFNHPKYVAHLVCPTATPAILAELISATINTSMDTWDQSAGATLIEQSVINWTAKKIGYDGNADGIFTSGGTQSNYMAMLLARDNYCLKQLNGHRVQLDGLPVEANRFRILASKVSHFSVQKSAAQLGLGFNAVIPVDCDVDFRMKPESLSDSLDYCKESDLIPIAVVATMGTTDFGSIDPIQQIADICHKENIWLHADAAYGCGLLISQKYANKINGIHLADSVTVDYHKSWYQPVACSAFIAKDANDLKCLTYHADYLNPLKHDEKGYPNLVCKSIQTTRRFDALKPWLTLRILGEKTLGNMFDQVIDLASKVYQLLNVETGFETIHEPEISAVVFRLKPYRLEDGNLLNELNEHIYESYLQTGNAMIALTKVNGNSCLKFTLLNPLTTLNHIQEIIDEIKAISEIYLQNVYCHKQI